MVTTMRIIVTNNFNIDMLPKGFDGGIRIYEFDNNDDVFIWMNIQRYTLNLPIKSLLADTFNIQWISEKLKMKIPEKEPNFEISENDMILVGKPNSPIMTHAKIRWFLLRLENNHRCFGKNSNRSAIFPGEIG